MARTEKYSLRGPDGSAVAIERNLDTGAHKASKSSGKADADTPFAGTINVAKPDLVPTPQESPVTGEVVGHRENSYTAESPAPVGEGERDTSAPSA